MGSKNWVKLTDLTEMSQKLKFHNYWNVTKTEISFKYKCKKMEMSQKLTCLHFSDQNLFLKCPQPFLSWKYSWKSVEINQKVLLTQYLFFVKKKRKKYSRINNLHISFANTLGQSFPQTSETSWCVENCDLKFFKINSSVLYTGVFFSKFSSYLNFLHKKKLFWQ